jgi:hypothetical protein
MTVFFKGKGCIRRISSVARKYGVSSDKIPGLPHILYAGFLYNRIICKGTEDFEALETAIELEWGC